MNKQGTSETPQLSTTFPYLTDGVFKQKLQVLRQTDNSTNWYFLFRCYVYFGIVAALSVFVYESVRVGEISWMYAVPTLILSVLLMGAGQHQLSGLAHEGVHHILFRNRMLNELASDWLTMFPVFSATHLYRMQHLAHHQFVNDPDRDPDVSQLQTSGHWLNFPISRKEFLRTILKQLWLPNLVRFMRVRAKYNATGADKNPYLRPGHKPARTAVRIGISYILSLVVCLILLSRYSNEDYVSIMPFGMWLTVSALFYFLPARCFNESRLHPVIALRYMTMMRLGFVTLVFTSLAMVTIKTDTPAWMYYYLLWLLPMFSSFAFFMILRQIVQHGNADRSWLGNTRTFFVGRILNFAVFPMGQDYHLPHHMYSTIPHYRLKELHELLMQYPEYANDAIVVEGYFSSPNLSSLRPTVVEVLGPQYATRSDEISMDHSVLDDVNIEDKREILDQEKTILPERKQAHHAR